MPPLPLRWSCAHCSLQHRRPPRPRAARAGQLALTVPKPFRVRRISSSRDGWTRPRPRRGWRSAIQPTRAAAYSVLGTISFQRKRLDESIVFFKKAIQLDERLVGAHLSLAQVYMLQGKPALALTLFERVLKAAPSNADARLGVAWSAMEAGQYPRSMEVAAPLMAEWTPASNVPPDLAIKFGVLFATHGAAPQAIDILERIRKATRAIVRAGVQSRRRVSPEQRSRARAGVLRRGARAQAGFVSGAAPGGGGRRAARGAGAIAVVLDARQEGRSRRSGDPSGLRSRVPPDGFAGRRGDSACEGGSPEAGRPNISIHARRREGRQEAVRSRPASRRTARRPAADRSAAALRARIGPVSRGTAERSRRALA